MKEIEVLKIDGEEVDLKQYAKKEEVGKLSEEIADLKALLVDGNEVEY